MNNRPTHPLIQQIDKLMGCEPAEVEKDLAAANSNGEITGFGPAWMCADFGKPGHDYIRCKACWHNFEISLETLPQGAEYAEH